MCKLAHIYSTLYIILNIIKYRLLILTFSLERPHGASSICGGKHWDSAVRQRRARGRHRLEQAIVRFICNYRL